MSKHTKTIGAKKVVRRTKHDNDQENGIEYIHANEIILCTRNILRLLRRTLFIQQKLLMEEHERLIHEKENILNYDCKEYTDDWIMEAYMKHNSSSCGVEKIKKRHEEIIQMQNELCNTTQEMEKYQANILMQESELISTTDSDFSKKNIGERQI
jgi:hypothetical protein